MPAPRILVLLLFFLSGASGLVYQVVWTRQLALVFGISVFAVSAVLAAYMGGLALGSFYFGRVADRYRNPVRLYAWLEIGVGISALLMPLGFGAVEIVYLSVATPLEDQFLLFNFTRAILAIVPLLVPTTLMGGTVPAIGRFLIRHPGEFGWNAGLLYGVNTFGAVVGTMLAGFLLVPSFSLHGVVFGAAVVNIAIGVVLIALRVGDDLPAPERAAAPEVAPAPVSNRGWLAIGVFALSGFAALGFEIIWTRALVLHVHNSTYAFTLMLAIFLAGLALGDMLMVRFYDRLERPLLWLGGVQLGVAFSVLAAAGSYTSVRDISLGLLSVEALDSWAMAIAIMTTRAGLVLLPSTILLGMVFPLVVRVVCGDMRDLGRHMGLVYGGNTLGAIAGSLGTAFVLIPLLGLRGSLVALAALSALLGGACVVAAAPSAGRRVAGGAVAVGVAALPFVLIPATLFVDAYDSRDWKLIFYKEGITDATGVYENRKTGDRWVTYGDQRGTAGTHTASVAKREAHIAHLLHPDPVRSLQIGFGVGNTLAAAALYPEVEQLDVVELSAHIPDTAPFFWTNDDVLERRKVRLIVDDGRNYLMRTEEKYDVVTLEPPEIFTAGVVNLYTREFYELAYDTMTEDGIIVNWIPTYTMGELEAKMLTRAVLEVFPHTSLWYQGALTERDLPLVNMLLVVGSKQPLALDPVILAKRMATEPVRTGLVEIGNPTPASLMWHYIAGTETLREWTSDVDATTDDRTVVDFTSATRKQAGFGFGHLRPFEYLGMWGNRAENDLAMFQLFQRLREPMDSLVREGPGKAELLRGIEEERAAYDQHVAALVLRKQRAQAARRAEGR